MESDGVNDLAWVDCFVDGGVSPKGFHVVRKLLQIRSTNLKIDIDIDANIYFIIR